MLNSEAAIQYILLQTWPSRYKFKILKFNDQFRRRWGNDDEKSILSKEFEKAIKIITDDFLEPSQARLAYSTPPPHPLWYQQVGHQPTQHKILPKLEITKKENQENV